MPEMPDIAAYLHALEPRVLGQPMIRARIFSPFVLRTVDPPVTSIENRKVGELRRLGKRIAFGFEEDVWLVLHLMIAGRLHWKDAKPVRPSKRTLAALAFPAGTLILTEAGTQKRASLHLVRGEDALKSHDPGGLEVLEADLSAFQAALTRENRTLKRALTDPRILSGIGNAYSDEILHRARLSPVVLTQKLSGEEIGRLYRAARDTLTEWTERLLKEAGDGFPERVTAFDREADTAPHRAIDQFVENAARAREVAFELPALADGKDQIGFDRSRGLVDVVAT